MRVKEKFTKKLLVEGNDDQHVVWSLCDRFAITESFDVVDCEGIAVLLQQISVRLKQSGIKAIGIVIDADSDISARWQSISSILRTQGFMVPSEIPETGLVIRRDEITFGVWIMPNNVLNGMIEDFIRFLIPVDDRLLDVAITTLDQIEHEDLNNYNLLHRPKSLIHTWLAWQESPGIPMGSAITRRFLTTEVEICQTFVDWLNTTFN